MRFEYYTQIELFKMNIRGDRKHEHQYEDSTDRNRKRNQADVHRREDRLVKRQSI